MVKAAQQVLDESTVPVDIFFKFTCVHCGERCMLQEPNMLYEKGECHACGKETEIKVGGYTLALHLDQLKQQKGN